MKKVLKKHGIYTLMVAFFALAVLLAARSSVAAAILDDVTEKKAVVEITAGDEDGLLNFDNNILLTEVKGLQNIHFLSKAGVEIKDITVDGKKGVKSGYGPADADGFFSIHCYVFSLDNEEDEHSLEYSYREDEQEDFKDISLKFSIIEAEEDWDGFESVVAEFGKNHVSMTAGIHDISFELLSSSNHMKVSKAASAFGWDAKLSVDENGEGTILIDQVSPITEKGESDDDPLVSDRITQVIIHQTDGEDIEADVTEVEGMDDVVSISFPVPEDQKDTNQIELTIVTESGESYDALMVVDYRNDWAFTNRALRESAEKVTKIIEDLRDPDSEMLAKAREAYEKLSEEAKRYVSREALAKLFDEINKEKAKEEINKIIEKISSSAGNQSINQILEKVKEAYKNLSENAKINISLKDFINKITERIKEKSDEGGQKRAAQEVMNLLNSLTAASSAEEVARARAAYDGLDDKAKAFVDKAALDKLIAQEERIKKEKSNTSSQSSSSHTASANKVEVGKTYTVAGSTYLVTKLASANAKGSVTLTGAKNKASFNGPETVKLADGYAYTLTAVKAKAFTGSKIKKVTLSSGVNKIYAKAFSGSKVKKLILKTKKLKKKNVKNSLKGSKITTVIVKVGNKKANKTYVKKYKKIFTKKNTGKKVIVK